MLLRERDGRLTKKKYLLHHQDLIWTGYLLPFCKQLPVGHKYERSMDGIEYETFQAGNTYTKGSKSSLTSYPAVETSVLMLWIGWWWWFDMVLVAMVF